MATSHSPSLAVGHAGEASAGHSTAHGGHDHHHPSPTERLGALLRGERSDLIALFIYTAIAGMLGLAVPLGVQALVNFIAQGLFLQPLVVLTLLVLGGLMAGGIIQLLELVLVERLQQRIFARVAINLADRLPRIQNSALEGAYAPELVNRFFDVLTVQKTLAKLLLDGLSAFLAALVGLVLLAMYSPLLLGLDVLILLSVGFIMFGLGVSGLRTSIDESKQKYRVAAWLEDLARCARGFKMNGQIGYLIGRADNMVMAYITARRSHFRVVFRQAAGNYLFQALASAGVLGLGGWLVINRELTLGQLVAAELIVVKTLASVEKLIRQADQFYDLLTALDKVGHVTDMPVERSGGLVPSTYKSGERAGAMTGSTVTCRGVRFAYSNGLEVLKGINLTLESGDHVSLVGESGAGKSTLASLLCGLEEPSLGAVQIDSLDVRQMDLEVLRRAVALVGDTGEIFDGTLEENLTIGRDWVTPEDVLWALEVAQFTRDLARLPDGVRTQLVSGGGNLSRGQVQRLLIARAIVDRPSLLILDEAFTGIDERTKLVVLDALYHPDHPWTIIDISHDAEVVTRSGLAHVLQDGVIVESDHPLALAQRENSVFAALFPDLCRQLRSGASADR